MNLHTGETTAAIFCALSAAWIVTVFVRYYLRARVQQLTQRERAVQYQLSKGIFDNDTPMDSYIFKRCWKVEHVFMRAQVLGHALQLHDIFQIVAAIRRDFTIEEGLTLTVIDRYIEAHVEKEKNLEIQI